MSVQQPSTLPSAQASTTYVGENAGMRVEVGTQTGFVPPTVDTVTQGKALDEADQSHPHIEMQVIQASHVPTPAVIETQLPEPISVPAKTTDCSPEPVKDHSATDEPTTEEKPSAWRRFVEGITHDPLNDPEFVEAYKVWQKQNRKERYDRRRAWIVAHGCKVGCLLGFVKKDRKDEAWQAYREKLAYMED
ncbi:hypothetical protein QFC22_002480 [Naganishia vaughanmartiniae]|uniref:Uncharacterized protein n=1 Tax=Naganishia vaughanmartiniae TaxID=1424756 RepID=A0ACC2XF11_9TREE|nr:hypothetical protein QFC22_002480 [Naganishia vaughanmartiniae]